MSVRIRNLDNSDISLFAKHAVCTVHENIVENVLFLTGYYKFFV
jgi:hypothetical protein